MMQLQCFRVGVLPALVVRGRMHESLRHEGLMHEGLMYEGLMHEGLMYEGLGRSR